MIYVLRRTLRTFFWAAVLLIALPVSAGALWFSSQGWPGSWHEAQWHSTGTAPDPAFTPEAVVRIYSARTGRWKSIFAVHSWIAVKPAGASSWSRFEVVGWGRPIRQNAYPVDALWYSNPPMVSYELRGEEARRAIPKIVSAISNYPHSARGSYTIWPGPNSNTFVAHVVRQVPELKAELPARAMGKDYLGEGLQFATTPSHTGWQMSWNGVAGLAVAWEEGLELHVLGATIGIDPLDLAIKLPSFGRLGLLE